MQKCPSCPRAGDDIGNCGSHLLCPRTSIPVEPGKDVILHCEPCDKTRVISVTDLIHGRRKGLDLQCPRGDDCACRSVSLPVEQPMAPPPPQTASEATSGVAPPKFTAEVVKPGTKAGPRAAPKKP